MNADNLIVDLEKALAELPMFDVHTHLAGGRLGGGGACTISSCTTWSSATFTRRAVPAVAFDPIPRLGRPGRSPRPHRRGPALFAVSAIRVVRG